MESYIHFNNCSIDFNSKNFYYNINNVVKNNFDFNPFINLYDFNMVFNKIIPNKEHQKILLDFIKSSVLGEKKRFNLFFKESQNIHKFLDLILECFKEYSYKLTFNMLPINDNNLNDINSTKKKRLVIVHNDNKNNFNNFINAVIYEKNIIVKEDILNLKYNLIVVADKKDTIGITIDTIDANILLLDNFTKQDKLNCFFNLLNI